MTCCKGCDRAASECGPLSATYLCRDCGEDRFLSNLHQLQAHSGPFFDYWRERCLAGFGVFVHDEAR